MGEQDSTRVYHAGDMEPDLAESIASMLEISPELCVQVKGRVGGLPHVRYRNGSWDIATWGGPGMFMGFWNDHDRDDVVELIKSGPMVIPKRVDDLDIWEIYDGSVPDDMELYFVDCECGAATMREYERGAKSWAEEHSEECDDAGILEVSKIDG